MCRKGSSKKWRASKFLLWKEGIQKIFDRRKDLLKVFYLLKILKKPSIDITTFKGVDRTNVKNRICFLWALELLTVFMERRPMEGLPLPDQH